MLLEEFLRPAKFWLILIVVFLIVSFSLFFACEEESDDDDDDSKGGDPCDTVSCEITAECVSAYGDGWGCQGGCCVDLGSGDDDTTDDDTSDDDDDDTTGPAVIYSYPADGDDELRLATNVIVSFNETMDQTSVENAFNLYGSAKPTAGTFTWNDAGSEVTFKPQSNLMEDLEHTISIDAAAHNLSGETLDSAFSATFETVNLWTRTYNGTESLSDKGRGVVADEQGNVYVAGYYYITAQNNNIWARKYDKEGNTQWTHIDNGTASGSDMATAIDVDIDGNVYAVGSIKETSGGTHLFLRQLDNATGMGNWTYTYDDSAVAVYGYGVSAKTPGSVYAIGRVQHIWVGKIDTVSHFPDWVFETGCPYAYPDTGNDVISDSSGNAYFTGSYYTDYDNTDIWVRKYTSSGLIKWTVIHETGVNNFEEGKGITLDSQGNVYVCGYTTGGSFKAAWLGKFSENGTLLWSKSHTVTGEAYGITSDQQDNIYVTGYEEISGQQRNVWLQKYSPDGNVYWKQTFNGTANEDDIGYGVAVDGNGNVIVAGYETVSGEQENIWVRKYDPDGHWAD